MVAGGLLGAFSKLFIFLFVFVVIFGLLEITKLFGSGKEGVNALLALIIAVLAMFSSRVVAIIGFISPWFVLIFIILFFIAVGVKFTGGEKIALFDLIKQPIVHWSLIIIAGIIVMAGFIKTKTVGIGTEAERAVSLDPKILGIVMVFLIVIFAVLLLAEKVKK